MEAEPARRVAQGRDVLRKARAAVAEAGLQEVAADAPVAADAVADALDVGAGGRGERRDLVDEADARRQHRIGRALGQLGTARVHRQHRRAALDERPISAQQPGRGAGGVAADEDAVGREEILHRRAFAQEFRVADRAAAAARGVQCGLHAPGRADRHGRLQHHHARQPRQRAQPRDHLVEGLELGRAVAPRRRADRDEDQFGLRHRGAEVAAEAQPRRADLFGHELGQPRFVDRQLRPLQGFDLVRVDVDRADPVAELREAGGGDETDIADADHCDAQASRWAGVLRARTQGADVLGS